jgi:hypothetical protein
LLTAGVVGGALVGAYMLYSKSAAGTFVPLSGKLKTQFPRIWWSNFWDIRQVLSVLIHPEAKRYVAWRCLQLLVPLGIASVHLIVLLLEALKARGRRAPSPWSRAMLVVSLLIVQKHTYNLLFVFMMSQGHWYYPVSFVMSVVIVVDWLARSSRLRHFLASHPRRKARVAALLVAVQALYFFLAFFPREPIQSRFPGFFGENPYSDHPYRLHRVFRDRASLSARFGDAPPKGVDLEDGAMAFSLGAPMMSGLMLNLDAAYQVLRVGKSILHVAYERGYDRVYSCYELRGLLEFDDPTPEDVAKHMGGENPCFNFKAFKWELEHISPEKSFVVLRFEPLPQTPPKTNQ